MKLWRQKLQWVVSPLYATSSKTMGLRTAETKSGGEDIYLRTWPGERTLAEMATARSSLKIQREKRLPAPIVLPNL
jgi:hypothetical protein